MILNRDCCFILLMCFTFLNTEMQNSRYIKLQNIIINYKLSVKILVQYWLIFLHFINIGNTIKTISNNSCDLLSNYYIPAIILIAFSVLVSLITQGVISIPILWLLWLFWSHAILRNWSSYSQPLHYNVIQVYTHIKR